MKKVKESECSNEIINISLTLFSLLFVLAFTYFIYYSNQMSNIKSELITKINEINAISPPYPTELIQITKTDNYEYLKRKEALLSDFDFIVNTISKSSIEESKKIKFGYRLQNIITQISFFYPYKRVITFEKDGSWVFDPNESRSIFNTREFSKSTPNSPENSNLPESYNSNILFEQVNQWTDLNIRFTVKLRSNKDKIIECISLAFDFVDSESKLKLAHYYNRLLDYLDEHYKNAIPLGLILTKYEYYLEKIDSGLLLYLSSSLLLILFFGVVIPLFNKKLRDHKFIWGIPILVFLFSVFYLGYELYSSLPY